MTLYRKWSVVCREAFRPTSGRVLPKACADTLRSSCDRLCDVAHHWIVNPRGRTVRLHVYEFRRGACVRSLFRSLFATCSPPCDPLVTSGPLIARGSRPPLVDISFLIERRREHTECRVQDRLQASVWLPRQRCPDIRQVLGTMPCEGGRLACVLNLSLHSEL